MHVKLASLGTARNSVHLFVFCPLSSRFFFFSIRDEGRVARKLLASLNIFLLKDGVNLGDLLIDVHSSIKGFILRTWKVTRDRELKVLFFIIVSTSILLPYLLISSDIFVG